MSEYLGVITWNVKGDLAEKPTGAKRMLELNRILADLSAAGDCPVHILCFQETSGDGGALKRGLERAGYTCCALREGDEAGMQYLFALPPGSDFVFDEEPQRYWFQYRSSASSPLRYPAGAKLTRVTDGLKAAVYTFHATLGGAQLEGVTKCSELAAEAAGSAGFDYVFVAGDLNFTAEDQFFDQRLGRNVNLMKRLFRSFAGVSHHLDHVLCWRDLGMKNIKGSAYSTTSDHDLVYARFKIG